MTWKSKIFVIWTLISVLVPPASAQTLQGHFESREGDRWAVNPASPILPPETHTLEELWRIGDDDDEHVLGRVAKIIMDPAGNTYILDSQLKEVAIFDADGCWLRNIGREGEGPGEFRHPVDILLKPDGSLYVLQLRPGSIQHIAANGDPLPNIPVPQPDQNGFCYFTAFGWSAHGTVLQMYQVPKIEGGGLLNIDALVAIDEQGDETACYVERQLERRVGDNVRVEGDYGRFPADWDFGPDGRIVVRTRFDGYELTVYLPGGEVDFHITRQYESLARSPEVCQQLQAYMDETNKGRNWRGHIGPVEYEMSRNHGDIQEIFIREDGSLWVLPSRGSYDAPRGTMGTFDVFDQEGRFLRQVTLLGEGDYWADEYIIAGDCLFVVTNTGREIPGWIHPEADPEQERGDRHVICYRLPW